MDKVTRDDLPANNDPWASLKTFTAARVAIGRTGDSIPLQQMLAFKLAHAHARDAVYSELDLDGIITHLKPLNLPAGQLGQPLYHLHSMAANREQYIKRPDYGRRLDTQSVQQLEHEGSLITDVSVVITDGLSAMAVNQYAAPLLLLLTPRLRAAGFTMAPLSLIEQGRVAIADEVGYAFRSKMVVILIGERPGLSAPDSMSAYLTYNPQPGLTDESRNCISNIRPDGLNISAAAEKLFYLISQSLRLKLTGVDLKDNQGLLAQ